MADDRKAVEGAIDYAILQAGAAPSSRIGAAGWIQGVGYDWLQGRINSGSSLGSRGSILNKLIQAGFGGTFIAPFNDLGNGEVDTSLLVGTGSATFTRATTATTVNSAGTIVSVASGTPRSYYDPTTLQYLGYLSEGARTNLCLQSQDLSNAKWIVSNSTVTANNIAAPDGTTTGNKILETVAVGTHQVIYDNAVPITISSATVYTLSVFAKAGLGRDWFRFGDGSGNLPGLAYFNLTTGVVGTVTSGTATIKAYPDGWYRCTVTSTSAGTTCRPQIATADSDGNVSYAGDITKGIYAWGAQLEAGSFASTYIPTTTASVTRNADVLTYPFAGNALDTVGSAYAEMLTFSTTGNGTSSIPLALSASGLMMYLNSSDARTASNLFDGTNSATKTGLSDISTATRKRGCSWGGLGLINTGDGLTTATSSFDGSMGSTSIAVGSTTAGASQWFGTLRNIRIYQTQLSASQLQAITA